MTMTRVWKSDMAEFICNLKRYRLLKDLTQEQLANLGDHHAPGKGPV